MFSRRVFLKAGGVALFTLGAGPQFLTRTALAAQEEEREEDDPVHERQLPPRPGVAGVMDEAGDDEEPDHGNARQAREEAEHDAARAQNLGEDHEPEARHRTEADGIGERRRALARAHQLAPAVGEEQEASRAEPKDEQTDRGREIPPRGGDTDQLRAVGVGECSIAISNHYYYVRIMRSDKPEDRALIEKVGIIWPNQGDRGTHINISGGGMLRHAPNRDAAIKFLEYLASDNAQTLFANGNNEWPIVRGVKLANSALESLGQFKTDALPLASLGKTQAAAQRLADQVGWK